MSRVRSHSRKAPIVICVVCTLIVAAQYFFESWTGYTELPVNQMLIERLKNFRPLGSAEFYMQDAIARFFGRRSKQRPEIVYLAIDRDSIQLDQFDPAEIEASPALTLMKQGWPWPRAVYSLILDKLFHAGAKVVAMDLMFPTPRAGDEVFRAALDKYRNHVVIGSNFVEGSRGDKETNTLQLPADDLIQGKSPLDDRIGFVNFWPDRDEVIRRVHYTRSISDVFGDPPEAGEEVYRSLSVMTLQKSGNSAAIPPPVPAGFASQAPRAPLCPNRSVIFSMRKSGTPRNTTGVAFFRIRSSSSARREIS